MIGDPPDYELLPFDWQVRGYTLGTHRGKSLLAANFEYRFIAEPDIFQGVVFADFGRSWDNHVIALSGLEFGYGVGLRIYTAPFIPYNLLLRLDYGWSDNGEEFLFGFNQFF
jgi:outer membrane protein assembly factor BamA